MQSLPVSIPRIGACLFPSRSLSQTPGMILLPRTNPVTSLKGRLRATPASALLLSLATISKACVTSQNCPTNALTNRKTRCRLGQEMEFKILRIDAENRKIGLSARAAATMTRSSKRRSTLRKPRVAWRRSLSWRISGSPANRRLSLRSPRNRPGPTRPPRFAVSCCHTSLSALLRARSFDNGYSTAGHNSSLEGPAVHEVTT